MKRIAAAILSIVLIINIIPMGVSADSTDFTDYKEAVYDAIYNVKSEVELSKYNVTLDEVSEYLSFLVHQHPEIDYFYGYSNGHYTDSSRVYLSDLELSYTMEKAEVMARRAYIDETLRPLLEKIDDNWTDTQKALYVHDWLVANFMYDYRLYEEPGTENHDIYGFLRDGIGVCQSYAYTFMYAVRKVGLESYMVITDSKIVDGEDISGHGWNVVKIDGNWYHVDTTYDDPILGVEFHYDYVGKVSHEKFLISDEQIVTDYEHYGFYIPYVNEEIICNEYEGNDSWRTAVSSVLNVGEYWYYLDPNGENGGLLRTKDFENLERVMEVGRYHRQYDMYIWDKDDNTGFLGYYTGLFEYNEHLFFSDSRNIYVYDTHHDEVNTLPIDRIDGNYYFGLNMDGKKIKYITSRANIRENVVEGYFTLSGHPIITAWEQIKAPTVTEDGLKIKRCYICGEVVESQTIPMLSAGKRGDVDGSGSVDVSDLAVMKLFLAGARSDIGYMADVDSNNSVDVTDLAKLKLFLAGAISDF